jgi:hypothetical protein
MYLQMLEQLTYVKSQNRTLDRSREEKKSILIQGQNLKDLKTSWLSASTSRSIGSLASMDRDS